MDVTRFMAFTAKEEKAIAAYAKNFWHASGILTARCRWRQEFRRPWWPTPNGASLARHFLTRVSIAIQFTSHVLPPSVENDCSNLQDSGLMSEMMKRTRTGRPLKSSWSKNSPRPFLNSPTVGVPSVPALLLANEAMGSAT